MENPSILWYKDPAGKTAFIAFQATMEENHQGQATVSKYPIQDGFLVSNHLIRQNRVINVKAIIPDAVVGGVNAVGAQAGSDVGRVLGVPWLGTSVGGVVADPLGVAENYLGGLAGAAEVVLSPVAGAVDEVTSWFGDEVGADLSEVVDKFLADPSRKKDAFNRVQWIQESGQLCSLSTVLKDYTNLVLTSYSVPTSTQFLSSAYLDLTFEEVVMVGEGGKVLGRVAPSETSQEDQKGLWEQTKSMAGGVWDKSKDFADNIWKEFG